LFQTPRKKGFKGGSLFFLKGEGNLTKKGSNGLVKKKACGGSSNLREGGGR